MSDDDASCCCVCVCVLVVCVIMVLPVYRPLSFYPRLDSAVLAALDHSVTPPPDSTDALRYNLSVNLSFRNSHRNVEIRYLDMVMAAFYGDFMLGLPDRTFPTPFSQGKGDTKVFLSSFHGTVAVFPSVAAEVERERTAGLVHLRVRVSLKLQYKIGRIQRILAHSYRYDCWMWFQPPPSNVVPAVFDAGTQCLAAK